MAGCHVSSVGLRVLRIPAGVFVVGVSAMQLLGGKGAALAAAINAFLYHPAHRALDKTVAKRAK
jgi:hypothetical protein